MNFICGHRDAGTFGVYTYRAVAPEGHCGPSLSKFKQHPMRNPDGTLKRDLPTPSEQRPR